MTWARGSRSTTELDLFSSPVKFKMHNIKTPWLSFWQPECIQHNVELGYGQDREWPTYGRMLVYWSAWPAEDSRASRSTQPELLFLHGQSPSGLEHLSRRWAGLSSTCYHKADAKGEESRRIAGLGPNLFSIKNKRNFFFGALARIITVAWILSSDV